MVFKKREEPKPEPKPQPKPKPKFEGPLCDCGNPVAPGQTYVCRDHIRT